MLATKNEHLWNPETGIPDVLQAAFPLCILEQTFCISIHVRLNSLIPMHLSQIAVQLWHCRAVMATCKGRYRACHLPLYTVDIATQHNEGIRCADLAVLRLSENQFTGNLPAGMIACPLQVSPTPT